MRSNAFISRERLRLRLVVVMTTVVVLAVLSMFLVVVNSFSAALAPELENRTRLIGANVRRDLQRVIQMGIPLGAEAGIEGFLEAAVAPFPEVRRAAVIGANGTVVAEILHDRVASPQAGQNLFSIIAAQPAQFSFPIIAGNREVGRVEIEGSAQFVQTRLRSIFLDVSQGHPDSDRQWPSAKLHRRPAAVELQAVKLSCT